MKKFILGALFGAFASPIAAFIYVMKFEFVRTHVKNFIADVIHLSVKKYLYPEEINRPRGYGRYGQNGTLYSPSASRSGGRSGMTPEEALERYKVCLNVPCPEKDCNKPVGELCDTPSVWVHASRMEASAAARYTKK